MAKILIKILKFLSLFMFYWFINNGFLLEPIWLIIQALFFTAVTIVIVKVPKIKLNYWFYLVAIFYITSMVLEIFIVPTYPEIVASTGFGLLVILIVSRIFQKK